LNRLSALVDNQDCFVLARSKDDAAIRFKLIYKP